MLGIDATAAQTLGSLAMVLRRMGVELIITRVTNKSIRRLLVAHGIISATDAGGSNAAGITGAVGNGGNISRGSPNELSLNSEMTDAEQPLLQQEQEEEPGYCRVFDTLNEGAKYAEDR